MSYNDIEYLHNAIKEARKLCDECHMHAPVTGRLYKAKRAGGDLRIGDLVMVVSSNHRVIETDPKTGERLQFPEWCDLSVIHGERVYPLTCLPEDSWYVWFELTNT